MVVDSEVSLSPVVFDTALGDGGRAIRREDWKKSDRLSDRLLSAQQKRLAKASHRIQSGVEPPHSTNTLGAGRRLLGLQNQVVQTRFGPGRHVAVDDVPSTRLIQTLDGDAELVFRRRHVSGRYRLTNSFQLRSQCRLDRSIAGPAENILTQTFLGALGIGHGFQQLDDEWLR
jgi:hypothetical protein